MGGDVTEAELEAFRKGLPEAGKRRRRGRFGPQELTYGDFKELVGYA